MNIFNAFIVKKTIQELEQLDYLFVDNVPVPSLLTFCAERELASS